MSEDDGWYMIPGRRVAHFFRTIGEHPALVARCGGNRLTKFIIPAEPNAPTCLKCWKLLAKDLVADPPPKRLIPVVPRW